MNIPKWIGPALSPVVFILLMAIVCFYYCYWKPRRRKIKEQNQAVKSQKKRVLKSPTIVGKNYKTKLAEDEEMCYGSGYPSYDVCTSYGPYIDYCPLPYTGLNHCVPNAGRPKIVYCPKTVSCQSKSRNAFAIPQTRCTNKTWGSCRVQCPRGECIKCPHLPVISEGNSTSSLCEEKEEEEQLNEPLTDVERSGNDSQDNEREDVKQDERQSSSVDGQAEDTISDCCCDSGFEDHELTLVTYIPSSM